MNWIRIFLFALLSLCVTGSTAHIITHMRTRLFRITSPYIALAMQKAAALSFTLPLLFSVIFSGTREICSAGRTAASTAFSGWIV